MTSGYPKRQKPVASITQLDFERRTLMAKLDYGKYSQSDARRLVQAIENLDLAIAATPSARIEDIALKFDRLLETLSIDLDHSNTMEAVLLAAIRDDLAKFIDNGGNPDI